MSFSRGTDVRSAERILLSVSARLAVQTGAVRANPAMETKANRCHHAVQTHPLMLTFVSNGGDARNVRVWLLV